MRSKVRRFLFLIVGFILGRCVGFAIKYTPVVFESTTVIKTLLAFAYAVIIYAIIASFGFITYTLFVNKH